MASSGPGKAARLPQSGAPLVREARDGRRGRGRGPAPQVMLEGVRRERLAVEIALVFPAAERAQEVELLGPLDAFGDEAQAQAVRERRDGAHDGGVVRVPGKVADEGLVDLELLQAKALEVAQARIAGAEVVDRDLDAGGAQLLDHHDR